MVQCNQGEEHCTCSCPPRFTLPGDSGLWGEGRLGSAAFGGYQFQTSAARGDRGRRRWGHFRCLLDWASPPSGLSLFHSPSRVCALSMSSFIQVSVHRRFASLLIEILNIP